jgi:hypothetical protein
MRTSFGFAGLNSDELYMIPSESYYRHISDKKFEKISKVAVIGISPLAVNVMSCHPLAARLIVHSTRVSS